MRALLDRRASSAAPEWPTATNNPEADSLQSPSGYASYAPPRTTGCQSAVDDACTSATH